MQLNALSMTITTANLFFDIDGNGANNQTLVANFTNNPSLTHNDIYIAA